MMERFNYFFLTYVIIGLYVSATDYINAETIGEKWVQNICILALCAWVSILLYDIGNK